MMRSPSKTESGFTLVEVLVSLAIFSLAIVGMNRAATLAVKGTSDLQTRTHAGFVADNAVVLSRMDRLRVGTERTEAASGGMAFEVEVETVTTDLTGFYELRVRVREAERDRVMADRRAFRYERPPDGTGETP
ncbi:MAG: type II secretion system protein [Litorimonas sp.]